MHWLISLESNNCTGRCYRESPNAGLPATPWSGPENRSLREVLVREQEDIPGDPALGPSAGAEQYEVSIATRFGLDVEALLGRPRRRHLRGYCTGAYEHTDG